MTVATGNASRSPGVHPSSAAMRLYLLDTFVLQRDGERLSVPDGGQRLLALLALRQSPLPRDYVAGLLWADVSERQAHGALRTAIWRLQRLCPGLVVAHGGQLGLAAGIRVDVWDLARNARRLLGSRSESQERDLEWPCISGELLPGLYDDWILLERERIRQLYLHSLEAAAATLTARRRFGAALEAGLQALRIDPLRESAHRTVIEVHLAEGNVREALRQYDMCAELLWRELAVEPSGGMRELVRSAARWRQRSAAQLA